MRINSAKDDVAGLAIAKFGDHYMIEEDASLQPDYAKGTATPVTTSNKGRTYTDPDNTIYTPQPGTEETIIAKSGMASDGKVVLCVARSQILQQAGAAVLAQENQLPRQVLSLLAWN